MHALKTRKAIVVLGGAALGALAGLLLGALLGGNFATNFGFLHLRGYEATGVLGLVLGVLLGGALAARATANPRADYGPNSSEMRR